MVQRMVLQTSINGKLYDFMRWDAKQQRRLSQIAEQNTFCGKEASCDLLISKMTLLFIFIKVALNVALIFARNY